MVVVLLSMRLLPIDDDWFFLKYFDSAENWSVLSYTWLNDCVLLPRDYWRPWEDLFLLAETKVPYLYPFVNHFLVVSFLWGSGIFAYRLAIRLNIGKKLALSVIMIGLFAANNMGAMWSIDSLTMVMAVFFGLLSIFFFVSDIGGKYWLWLLCGIISCLSKESGFVYFIIAPLFSLLIEWNKNEGDIKNTSRAYWAKKIGYGLIPAFLYIGVYFSLKNIDAFANPDSLNKAKVSKDYSLDKVRKEQDLSTKELFTSSQSSHKLTPVTFVKNLYILYGAAIYPIDTMTVYYTNIGLLIFTVVIGFSGVILFVRLVLHRKRREWPILFLFGTIILVASAPSLITRAGEISPFASNFFLIIMVAFLLKDFIAKRVDYILLVFLLACTLITDIHKYYTAYLGGITGKWMAEEVVVKTVGLPDKVLWIGPEESRFDKAGAAFTKSPYRAFGNGNAVIAEYGYEYPKILDKVRLAPDCDQNMIDSVISSIGKKYDCVWITRGTDVKVLNMDKSVQ